MTSDFPLHLTNTLHRRFTISHLIALPVNLDAKEGEIDFN